MLCTQEDKSSEPSLGYNTLPIIRSQSTCPPWRNARQPTQLGAHHPSCAAFDANSLPDSVQLSTRDWPSEVCSAVRDVYVSFEVCSFELPGSPTKSRVVGRKQVVGTCMDQECAPQLLVWFVLHEPTTNLHHL